jgi:hypothetical protein
MKRAWEFGRLFLFSPSKAADACREKAALADGLKIYAILAVAELISSWFDPLAFLDPAAPPLAPHGVAFWMSVGVWEPVLFGFSVFFTVLVLDWMREGWLPMKTAAATAWAAVPVMIALYVFYSPSSFALGRGASAAIFSVWALPAVALARRIPAERWRKIGVFLLGLSAIQLVCLVLEFATVVPARSTPCFYALSFLEIGWLLVCAGIGLRKLCAMSTARVVLGFLFAVVVSSAAPVLAHLLGLMPMDVLKILLYV